jgi:hypothetical protein
LQSIEGAAADLDRAPKPPLEGLSLSEYVAADAGISLLCGAASGTKSSGKSPTRKKEQPESTTLMGHSRLAQRVRWCDESWCTESHHNQHWLRHHDRTHVHVLDVCRVVRLHSHKRRVLRCQLVLHPETHNLLHGLHIRQPAKQ